MPRLSITKTVTVSAADKGRKDRVSKRRSEETRDVKIAAESPEFQELFELLYAMYKGAAFAKKETNISHLSTAHRGLYKVAVECLSRHDKSKGTALQWLQSACVALSCTLDLVCLKEAKACFKPKFIELAKEACTAVWPKQLPPTSYDLAPLAERFDRRGGDLARMKLTLVRKVAKLGRAGDSPMEEKELWALLA
ncbi:hypothetical protein BGZ94_005857, partial [Podila epigama]